MLVIPFILTSCVSVYDSDEYISLNNKHQELTDKYEILSSNSKEQLLSQVETLEKNNSQIISKNQHLISRLKEKESIYIEISEKYSIAQAELAKTKKAFGHYISQNQVNELAATYLDKNGWEHVSLSTVQTYKDDYTSKKVVYVKFNTGLTFLYDGWYELGFMSSSFNMPRDSFGKSSFLGIAIIDTNGDEQQLNQCSKCE
jgi:hypothetical protein